MFSSSVIPSSAPKVEKAYDTVMTQLYATNKLLGYYSQFYTTEVYTNFV